MKLSRAFVLKMAFQTKISQQIKTKCYAQPPPPPENRAFYEIMWGIYGRAGKATDDNMMDALCMLGT